MTNEKTLGNAWSFSCHLYQIKYSEQNHVRRECKKTVIKYLVTLQVQDQIQKTCAPFKTQNMSCVQFRGGFALHHEALDLVSVTIINNGIYGHLVTLYTPT